MPAITVIPTITVTGSGYTLQNYYRRLATELGFYLPTSVTALATVGEDVRLVLADELRDDEVGYDLLARPWLYVSTGAQAGTQRRILNQPGTGYQGSMGALMLSRPFDAPLAAGSVIECTAPLPVRRHLGIKGLRECINEALALINVEARATITGNGTYEYDLASLPWLTNTNQTRGIYDTAYLDPTYPAQLSPWGYDIRVNGADKTLVTEKAYSSAETFDLAVIVKADRLVDDGTGTWTYLGNDAVPGLQDDDWQAAAPPQWVHAFAMTKALQFVTRLVLADKSMSKEEQQAILGADIMPRRRTYALAAAKIKLREFPVPLPKRREPLVVSAEQHLGWT